MNWISHSPRPRPFVLNSKCYHYASWASHVKILRIQNSEPPDNMEVMSKSLSSPACGCLYTSVFLGCLKAKVMFLKVGFLNALWSPGLVAWPIYCLVQWWQMMEMQWETAGPTPHTWNPQPHPSAGDYSFLLHTKSREALGSCTCTSERPHILVTHYLAFILKWQFKDWIRLQTYRSGRSLINNLIQLLAWSHGSQVNKNWDKLLIASSNAWGQVDTIVL